MRRSCLDCRTPIPSWSESEFRCNDCHEARLVGLVPRGVFGVMTWVEQPLPTSTTVSCRQCGTPVEYPIHAPDLLLYLWLGTLCDLCRGVGRLLQENAS